MKRDSYDLFMHRFAISEEALLEFGREHIVMLPLEVVVQEWATLVHAIEVKRLVRVRGKGRLNSGGVIAHGLYQRLFGTAVEVKVDRTNNQQPKALMRKLVKQYLPDQFQNYQVSHVWGKTKNPYAFLGTWNIVLIPKVLDPFSGHEAKGPIVEKFQLMLRQLVLDRYRQVIVEHDRIMAKLLPLAEAWSRDVSSTPGRLSELDCDAARFASVSKSLLEEFTPVRPWDEIDVIEAALGRIPSAVARPA